MTAGWRIGRVLPGRGAVESLAADHWSHLRAPRARDADSPLRALWALTACADVARASPHRHLRLESRAWSHRVTARPRRECRKRRCCVNVRAGPPRSRGHEARGRDSGARRSQHVAGLAAPLSTAHIERDQRFAVVTCGPSPRALIGYPAELADGEWSCGSIARSCFLCSPALRADHLTPSPWFRVSSAARRGVLSRLARWSRRRQMRP